MSVQQIQLQPTGRLFSISAKTRLFGIITAVAGLAITVFIILAVNTIYVSTIYHMETGPARTTAFTVKKHWQGYVTEKEQALLQLKLDPVGGPETQTVQRLTEHVAGLEKALKNAPTDDFLPSQVPLAQKMQQAYEPLQTVISQALPLLENRPVDRSALDSLFTDQYFQDSQTFYQSAQALQQSVTQAQDKAYLDRVFARDFYIVGVVIMAVASLIILLVVYRFISRPVVRAARVTSQAFTKLSEGDLTTHFRQNSNDEIGRMAPQFNQSVRKLRDLAAGAGQTVENLTGAAQELSAQSDTTNLTARQISNQATQVTDSAQSVAQTMEEVFLGTQELSSSIEDISNNAHRAADVAAEATQVAAQTNERVLKLGQSSESIGEVIATITEVAEQTNLLALNATIEAARVGEAGRGFAVVASEIKDLAAETSAATEQIARSIENIQTDTTQAVSAIEEISNIVSSINDHQSTIAAAVEEQNATTGQMSKSVEDASRGAQEIAAQIQNIAQSSNDSAEHLGQISSQMDQVSRRAAQLDQELHQFTY